MRVETNWEEDEREAWPPTARRATRQHLAKLGLPSTATFSEVLGAEVLAAQKEDERVSVNGAQRASARAFKAMRQAPLPVRLLSGFTRLVDGKFSLTPEGLTTLAINAAPDEKTQGQLISMINEGPTPGLGEDLSAWPRPGNPLELVASLVRHLALAQGASLQMQLSLELELWLKEALAKTDLRFAMGGAGGFGANLASTLPNVLATFYSKQALPTRVFERFNARVKTLDAMGMRCALKERQSDDFDARINYAAEYERVESYSLFGHDTLAIEGVKTKLCFGGAGRVILGTHSSDQPGFDLTDSALMTAAKEHDVFFCVGPHYLTSEEPKVCQNKAETLGRQLSVMKEANPDLLRHFQYVVPKVSSNEAILMKALRGAFDSVSLNSVELAALLSRLREAGISDWNGPEYPDRNQSEDPSFVLNAAGSLAQALGVARVHVHGLAGDFLFQTTAVDFELQRLAFLRARQMASIKAANVSGEIKEPEDIWPMLPTVSARGLVALERFADAVASARNLSSEERDLVQVNWGHHNDERTVMFVPSRGIHDFSGGTVSLGDTIDLTALLIGQKTQRAKAYPNLSSYR